MPRHQLTEEERRRGRGPTYGEALTKQVNVRMTKEDHKKIMKRGGNLYIRKLIREAA